MSNNGVECLIAPPLIGCGSSTRPLRIICETLAGNICGQGTCCPGMSTELTGILASARMSVLARADVGIVDQEDVASMNDARKKNSLQARFYNSVSCDIGQSKAER